MPRCLPKKRAARRADISPKRSFFDSLRIDEEACHMGLSPCMLWRKSTTRRSRRILENRGGKCRYGSEGLSGSWFCIFPPRASAFLRASAWIFSLQDPSQETCRCEPLCSPCTSRAPSEFRDGPILSFLMFVFILPISWLFIVGEGWNGDAPRLQFLDHDIFPPLSVVSDPNAVNRSFC